MRVLACAPLWDPLLAPAVVCRSQSKSRLSSVICYQTYQLHKCVVLIKVLFKFVSKGWGQESEGKSPRGAGLRARAPRRRVASRFRGGVCSSNVAVAKLAVILRSPHSVFPPSGCVVFPTANLRTKIQDFRGFDSSRILILRDLIFMSMRNSPESLSQAILAGRFLVGRFLVGRLGVTAFAPEPRNPSPPPEP